MKFNNLNLKKFIFETLNDLKFTTLTNVQEQVIPALLKNRNSIIQSETGSGKTLAFLIPLLNNIDDSQNELQSIIFVPTKDLAFQIKNILSLFTKNNSKIKFSNLIGGNHNIKDDIKDNQILIGTPSKIKELYKEGKVKLNNVNRIVFDEFDMIYDLNFVEHINFIFAKVNHKNLNISAFSATITKEIETFFNKSVNNPIYFNLIPNKNKENKNIKHYIIPTKHKDTNEILGYLLNSINPYMCLIFVNTKNQIDTIYNYLIDLKYKVCKIHGNMQTRERKQVIKKIHNLEYNYVICSDLFARGIDIEGVSHVISINLPIDLQYYIHRSGRTGRNNQTGESYILVNYDNLNQVNELKKLGFSFTSLVLKNNEFVENKNKRFILDKNHNTKKEFNYKKNMVFHAYSKVKPGYKNKRKKILKKIKKLSK